MSTAPIRPPDTLSALSRWRARRTFVALALIVGMLMGYCWWVAVGDPSGSVPRGTPSVNAPKARSSTGHKRSHRRTQRLSGGVPVPAAVQAMLDSAPTFGESEFSLVHCPTSLVPAEGGLGQVIADDDPTPYLLEWQLHPGHIVIPVREGHRRARVRLPDGLEISVTWGRSRVGEVVLCESVGVSGQETTIGGGVHLPDGTPAPFALIRGCGALVSTDQMGHFVAQAWVPPDENGCRVNAEYHNGASVVTGPPVSLQRGTLPDGHIELTVPAMPEWRAPPDMTKDEACAMATEAYTDYIELPDSASSVLQEHMAMRLTSLPRCAMGPEE